MYGKGSSGTRLTYEKTRLRFENVLLMSKLFGNSGSFVVR